ncbi:hypothetical protein M0811_08737 [Anaeramoeba ignava]|nr:hypothetical protein M0811_08737 [Anaeramoeba ignava]
MKLRFSTKKEEFDCKKWHSKCDDKGKTLIIIKTKDNYIFGGFTSIGFKKDKRWIYDSNSFIFSLRNDKNDRKPEKLSIKKGQESNAIYSHSDYGLLFGNDIYLLSNLQPGYSNTGVYYNIPNEITPRSNEAKNYLTGSYNSWVVDELETYFI